MQIRNTIEEHLFGILRGHDVSSDEEGLLTVADLQQLVTESTTASQMPNMQDAPAANKPEIIDIVENEPEVIDIDDNEPEIIDISDSE